MWHVDCFIPIRGVTCPWVIPGHCRECPLYRHRCLFSPLSVLGAVGVSCISQARGLSVSLVFSKGLVFGFCDFVYCLPFFFISLVTLQSLLFPYFDFAGILFLLPVIERGCGNLCTWVFCFYYQLLGEGAEIYNRAWVFSVFLCCMLAFASCIFKTPLPGAETFHR